MFSIADNLSSIRKRMASACARVNRDPAGVQLIGVTKTVALDRIREGVEAGLTILGENYVQEAGKKVGALQDLEVTWHFIGHLQSNKAKTAIELFDLIHTVDRKSLARELNSLAQKRGQAVNILLQVNVGEEETKSGTSPTELSSLFSYASSLDGLSVRGLMTLPPYLDDPEQVRPFFRQLRESLDRMRDRARRPELLTELSMGMSHDFEVAIEEGATLIRVGTALFGARKAASDR